MLLIVIAIPYITPLQQMHLLFAHCFLKYSLLFLDGNVDGEIE